MIDVISLFIVTAIAAVSLVPAIEGWYKGVTRMLQGWYKDVTRVL
jgi:hypothetical protein